MLKQGKHPDSYVPDISLYEYWGIEENPFDFFMGETQDIVDTTRAMRIARANNKMLAVIGNVGAGKTSMIRVISAKEKDFMFVRPEAENQWVISASGLSRSIIRQLRITNMNDSIPMDLDCRYREIGKLLHRHKEAGKHVILILDDGQQFNPTALRSLKRIREISYFGESNLLEVVIFAHDSGEVKLKAIEEVSKRLTTKRLNGFTPVEVEQYVTRAAGQYFKSPELIKIFSAKILDRRPAIIQGSILIALDRAMARNAKSIEEVDCTELVGLKALLMKLDLSQSELAKRASVSTATVSRLCNNEDVGDQGMIEKVREALGRTMEIQSDNERYREYVDNRQVG